MPEFTDPPDFGALRQAAIRAMRGKVAGSDLEDVAQEALLGLWWTCCRTNHALDTNHALEWSRLMGTIARRRVCDHLRQRTRQRWRIMSDLEALVVAEGPDPATASFAPQVGDRAVWIGAARRICCGRRQRAVLEGVLAGKMVVQIAQELGLPLKRVRRILDAMTRRLQERNPGR